MQDRFPLVGDGRCSRRAPFQLGRRVRLPSRQHPRISAWSAESPWPLSGEHERRLAHTSPRQRLIQRQLLGVVDRSFGTRESHRGWVLILKTDFPVGGPATGCGVHARPVTPRRPRRSAVGTSYGSRSSLEGAVLVGMRVTERSPPTPSLTRGATQLHSGHRLRFAFGFVVSA
jgi:hypothetical protein